MSAHRIITHKWPKPIPLTSFDWSAVTDDYDGASDAGFQPIGHGATEQAAIADLAEQIEEHGE